MKILVLLILCFNFISCRIGNRQQYTTSRYTNNYYSELKPTRHIDSLAEDSGESWNRSAYNYTTSLATVRPHTEQDADGFNSEISFIAQYAPYGVLLNSELRKYDPSHPDDKNGYSADDNSDSTLQKLKLSQRFPQLTISSPIQQSGRANINALGTKSVLVGNPPCSRTYASCLLSLQSALRGGYDAGILRFAYGGFVQSERFKILTSDEDYGTTLNTLAHNFIRSPWGSELIRNLLPTFL